MLDDLATVQRRKRFAALLQDVKQERVRRATPAEGSARATQEGIELDAGLLGWLPPDVVCHVAHHLTWLSPALTCGASC